MRFSEPYVGWQFSHPYWEGSETMRPIDHRSRQYIYVDEVSGMPLPGSTVEARLVGPSESRWARAEWLDGTRTLRWMYQGDQQPSPTIPYRLWLRMHAGREQPLVDTGNVWLN